MKITHCKLNKSIQNKLLEFLVLEVTARATADLLGIQANSGILFYRKIREVISYQYDLEYGSNTLTMHKDAIKPGQRVLITDDLLATGGTIEATIKLVEELGGIVVGIAFLIELDGLNGMDKLQGYDVLTLLKM